MELASGVCSVGLFFSTNQKSEQELETSLHFELFCPKTY